jgi:hypothetical protein
MFLNSTPVHALSYRMTQVFRGADEEVAVRIRAQEGDDVRTHSPTWPLPGDWKPGVEAKRDHALACALAFSGADWPDTDPLNNTLYYMDPYGSWMVDGGEAAYSGDYPQTDAGLVIQQGV